MDYVAVGACCADGNGNRILCEWTHLRALCLPAHARGLRHRDACENPVGSALVLSAWRAQGRFKHNIDLVTDYHRHTDVAAIGGEHRISMFVITQPHGDGILCCGCRAPVLRAITVHGEIPPEWKTHQEQLLSE